MLKKKNTFQRGFKFSIGTRLLRTDDKESNTHNCFAFYTNDHQRNFVCEICHKISFTVQSLQKHMILHEGNKIDGSKLSDATRRLPHH